MHVLTKHELPEGPLLSPELTKSHRFSSPSPWLLLTRPDQPQSVGCFADGVTRPLTRSEPFSRDFWRRYVICEPAETGMLLHGSISARRWKCVLNCQLRCLGQGFCGVYRKLNLRVLSSFPRGQRHQLLGSRLAVSSAQVNQCGKLSALLKISARQKSCKVQLAASAYSCSERREESPPQNSY